VATAWEWITQRGYLGRYRSKFSREISKGAKVTKIAPTRVAGFLAAAPRDQAEKHPRPTKTVYFVK
jgi:hypothetical protein